MSGDTAGWADSPILPLPTKKHAPEFDLSHDLKGARYHNPRENPPFRPDRRNRRNRAGRGAIRSHSNSKLILNYIRNEREDPFP